MKLPSLIALACLSALPLHAENPPTPQTHLNRIAPTQGLPYVELDGLLHFKNTVDAGHFASELGIIGGVVGVTDIGGLNGSVSLAALGLTANLIAFTQTGTGAVATTLDARARLGDVTPQDFGAIADGTSHPVSQWLTGGSHSRGYTNLAAIQADYPFVTSPTNEIDWAATMAAIVTKRNVYMPNGQYEMSAALRYVRFGQSITGQNWLFTQLYFTADTNGVEFRQYGTDEGDIVTGSILVGPASGEIGNGLRNVRLIGLGIGTSTKDGVSGDNSGGWDGDIFSVDQVFVQGFNRGVFTGGMANTRWGVIATFFNGDGFVGGLATQNGNVIQHLQSSNNTRHNLWLPSGIGWKIFTCDTNTGTNDGTADGVIGIEIGDGSSHSAGVHLWGGNGETQHSHGARCLYIHGGSEVIWDRPSFFAGTNSTAISPVYVEDTATFVFRQLRVGGYAAGVTSVEAELGSVVLGDGLDGAQCRYGGTNGTTTGAMAVSATDGEVMVPTWISPERDDGVDSVVFTTGSLISGRSYKIGSYVTGDDFTNLGATSNATGVSFVATGTTPTTWSHGSTIWRTDLRGQFRFAYGRNGIAGDAIYGYGAKSDGTPYKFNLDSTSLLSASSTWSGNNTFSGNNHFSGNTTIDFPVLNDGLQISGTLGSGRSLEIYNGATLLLYQHPGGELGPQSLHVGGPGGNGNATVEGLTTLNGLLHLTPRAAPGSPNEGDAYYGTDHHLHYYNGTAWVDL